MTAQQSRPGQTQAARKAFDGADHSVAAGADRSERHTGYVRVDLRRRWLTDRLMAAATITGSVDRLDVHALLGVAESLADVLDAIAGDLR